MTELEALLAKADRYCKTADLLVTEGDAESSVSRSYYAMFYAAQAILLTKDITAASHNGVLTKFSEMFIKTNILPREMSTTFAQAQAARQIGDYDAQPLITVEAALEQSKASAAFVAAIRSYLQQQGI